MNKVDNLIIYEIYPTSFYDSNGDGVGDLKGIEQKLDYIASLGVNAIWLNACFSSAFSDAGYDVTDYYSIDERFGTNDDFVSLTDACHQKGIKVIVDMVLGHTSEKHPWFLDSCKKERNEHSDWYIWTTDLLTSDVGCIANPKERDGCYRINYYATQPALNYGYENPDPTKPWQIDYKDDRLKPLREEVINIFLFWAKLGADGFRCDLTGSLIKNQLTEEPIKWLWKTIIGRVKEEYPDSIFMAEWGRPGLSVGKCGFDLDYLTHEYDGYNCLFRYEKDTNVVPWVEKGNSYFREAGLGDISIFTNYVQKVDEEINGNGAYVIPTGYHDVPRISIGRNDDMLKVIYAFLFTWKAVPMIYYGDEIGLKYQRGLHKDGGSKRTGARTPMQWNETKNRGFSTANETYLPTLDDEVSVEKKEGERGLLDTVRKLIAIHKKLPASVKVNVLSEGYPFVYTRVVEDDEYIVVLNPAKSESTYKIDYSEVILSNNCTFAKNEVKTLGVSFAILEK